MEIVEFDPETVAPSRRRIEELLGYEGGARPQGEVLKAFDEAFRIAAPLIKPRGIYRFLPAEPAGPKEIRLCKEAIIECPRLRRLMQCLEEAALFLVTVGPDVTEAIEHLQGEGRQLYSLIVDAYGSEAAEATAEAMQAFIAGKLAPQGRALTLRFSPGYCDWPLEDQRVVFSLLDFGKVGVRLTDNCIMLPRKSVTAVAGVGEIEAVAVLPIPCEECAREDCIARRAPFSERKGQASR